MNVFNLVVVTFSNLSFAEFVNSLLLGTELTIRDVLSCIFVQLI